MAAPGAWTQTGIVPDCDFVQLPVFYGQKIDVTEKASDGKPGALVVKQIEAKLRVKVLGPWIDLGFQNWYTTKKPINSLEDLRGLKLRSPGGAGISWRINFVGGIPNTTAWPNVPLALSQGTFDGIITSFETIASGQFWESGIRHALEDHQFVGEYVPLISLAFWQKLPTDLQHSLPELWTAKISDYRASMAAAQARARDTVQAHGIDVTVPSAEELAAKRAAMMAHQGHVAMLSRISQDMLAIVSGDLGSG
jgi:C4-dicarboxylate-binding protein DctP